MKLMSMTGFGRARADLSERFGVSVVVRSVNHRYLDIQMRTNLREETPELDAVVRAEISGKLQRGRISTQLNIEHGCGAGPRVTVNTDQVTAVLHQLTDISLPEGSSAELSLGDVLSIPGLVSVEGRETLLDEGETEALRKVVAEAVDSLLVMRADEGERLRRQIVDELGQVVEFTNWFEERMPEFRQGIMERVKERIESLTETEIDPDRIIQEAALLADRADVAEEVVRLRAHFETFNQRLAEGGTVGRTLDFLCQEIHRELNTLGSKCREAGVAERLVEAKSGAERVREQIQNLE